MNRREFLEGGAALGAGLGLGTANAAFAQAKPTGPRPRRQIVHRKAKTTKLFKAPGLYPNGLAVSPQGLWIAQQKISAEQASLWREPVPANRDEAAWLVDWNGKLLKTVMTKSRNTSGMAGALISCDAGVHPGWPDHTSPLSGYIFRIDYA